MSKSEITHLAAFLARPEQTVVRAVPRSRPAENQVLVRLEGCGICASSLSIWEGRPGYAYPQEAGAPGYEGWGVVEAVGASVTDIEIGQRVAMLSRHAYAEFDVTSSDCVVPLPEELDDEPFLADSFGRAASIYEHSGIIAGQSLAIVGDGFVELLLAQLGADAGARVVVLSSREDLLQLAEAMDAHETLRIAHDGHDASRALQLSGGRGFDCVVELTGSQPSRDLATKIVAEGACLLTASALDRSMQSRINDARKAIQAALVGRLDPFPLLTHTVTLSSLDHGFRLLRERPSGFVKAVMVNEMAA